MGSSNISGLDSIKEHLLREGWARVPGVLSTDEAASVFERLWQVKRKADADGQPSHLPHLDPNESNVRVFYLLEEDQTFRDLIAHPTAIEMAKTVLGDDFLISNFTANIARPGSKSMALHSDQSLVVPEPWAHTWAINVMWCLTDIYEENGATLFIPGSNQWQSQADVPADADKMLKPFEAKAGDLLITDARLWHTSGANITKDVDRALLFGYYTAPFLRQQINWSVKLPKEIKDTLSEDMKKWLGLGPMANTDKTDNHFYNFLEKQFGSKQQEVS